ncbi:transmembrane protein 26-like [Gigantopelta aegis]|uniref:transmembrane protein 26-like n=1 Tax=Gigantopelta aegis TaxID=1735272 RepID=UPI001B88ACDF|nr:transmembrane protein 26-like [Gigantopelta aegis]
MEESCKNIWKAVIVRLIFVIHSGLAYWRVASVYDKSRFYLLFLLLLQVAECLYTVIGRKGVEYKWFSSCFFFYIASTVPAIWMLEIDRLDRYTEIYQRENGTHLEALIAIKGVTLPFTLAPDIWVSLIEQGMLFLVIFGRLILPRGELSRDQLAELLFVFIGMASDNSDLFVLFDESAVRKDRGLTIAILVVWCLSMILYAVGLTVAKTSRGKFWSLLCAFLLQDFPYLIVRVVVLAKYALASYGVLFFLFKNIFVTILVFYKLFTLCDNEDD